MYRTIFKIISIFICMLLLPQSVYTKTRYLKKSIHSPVTESVVDNIRTIIAGGDGQNEHVFIIVGDSISAGGGENKAFLGNFEYPYAEGGENFWINVKDLTGYDELIPALDFFLDGSVPNSTDGEPTTTPFARNSKAARVGMSASWAITGNPSPLEQEAADLHPRYAVIMYGTNDVGGYGSLFQVTHNILENMMKIIDYCISNGIVPIVTAPPLRGGYEDNTITLQYALRAACQDKQVPYINYLKRMVLLPNHGLGNDNVHPTSYTYNKRCVFHPEALLSGYNMRNLLTLQSLDRMYQIVENGKPFLDQEPPALLGNGTRDNPYLVDEIAFADAGITTSVKGEYYYRLNVTQGFDMRALVTYQNSVNVDVSLLDSGYAELASHDMGVEYTLSPGIYYVKVENSSGLGSNSGNYQLLIMNTDISGPSKPENFTARAESYSQVILDWDTSTDNVDVTGYRIYRNSKEIAVTTQTSYTDTGPFQADIYSYTVTAFDEADNESFQAPLIVIDGESVANPLAPESPKNMKILLVKPSD